MRQWCLLVKRRSRGLRVRRTHSLHWIVRVCSRLAHEVVEVTKLLGSLYLCGCFLRERCDACNLQHHGVRQWCPSQVSNSRIVFSVWKSRMMQDETRHCEMMQDGVAELLSFLLPSFVKLVFSRERLRRVLRKKAAVILHLHTFTSADLHLHTFTSADLHLHTFTPADLDLHTFTSADLDLHTFTSADLVDLHTFTSADLDLHTFTPADLDLHTLTPADLDLHTFTSADLDLHTLTSADLHLHTLTSADLHLHTFTSADLDLHTLTSADLHLHTLTSADLHLYTFTSADLLSLFFYSLLRRGRCRRSATKRNPFARNGRWTSKT